MVVTTTFELEPVLEQYASLYPNGQFSHYQIAFKSEGEHQDGEYSYIIVFTIRPERERPDFWEFLSSYCTVNKGAAVSPIVNHIFPQFGMHAQKIAGTPPKKDK